MPNSCRLRLVAASLPLLLCGCLRTSVLVEKFNSGAIDTSGGDPKHPPEALRREIAIRRIKQELIDGYFGQAGQSASVPGWLQRDAALMDAAGPDQHWFHDRVVAWLCDHAKTAHVSCAAQETAPPAAAALSGATPPEPTTQEWAQQKLTAGLTKIVPIQPDHGAAGSSTGELANRPLTSRLVYPWLP